MESTTLVDTNTIHVLGQLALSISAIAAVVWGVVKFAVLRPLDRRIKDATRQIQPDANGGKSLSDVNGKVDELTQSIKTITDRLTDIEQRQLSIYEYLVSRRPTRTRKKTTDN